MWESKRLGQQRYSNNMRPSSQNKCDDIPSQIEVPNYLSSYVCPKCKLFYEFHATADGSYVGRIPLVLQCKHTVCGECIRKHVAEKLICCVECNATTELQITDIKKKMHEIFPINFYIFGVIMYYRQNKQKSPNLRFKPSGQVWNQEKPGAKCSTSSESVVTMMSVEKCSRKDCVNDATVNCPDCDETFCDNCASVLHNSAKGLMKHKYTRLLHGICPELTTTCATHRGSILEFHCKNCNVSLCCYCVLLNHKDHQYHQMTQMSEEDVVIVSGLVQDAEALLVQLDRAEKKICKHMDQNLPNGTSKMDLNVEITRFFENFHAGLQMLEKQMHREAMEYKEMRYNSLVMMRREVGQSITSITNLVNSARRAISNDDDVKLDVQSIKEGLKEALTTKCHVVHEDSDVVFEHGNAIGDLQDICSIKHTSINSFVLVNADDIPSNYEDSFSDISSVSLTPSLLNDSIGCSKTAETPDPNDGHGGVDSAYVDQWRPNNGFGKKWSAESPQPCGQNWQKVNTPFEEMCKVPTLKIGDKERVTVTHVNSPESFYVQLTRSTYSIVVLNQQIEKIMPKNQVPVMNPKLHGIYLVGFKTERSSEFEMEWYRARILSIIEDKFSVFFIDYGNMTVVPKKWIKNMPEELAKIPPFGIECKIHDIFPNKRQWDQGALSLIVNIVKDVEVLMIILNKTLLIWEVDLITMDGDTSIRDALIFIGAGTPQVQEHYEVKKAKEDMSCRFNQPTLYAFSKKFVQYEEAQVIITFVKDPHHLYVNMVDHQESMKELKKSMRTHYTENPKGFLYTPKENMPVAVSIGAGNWYRGTLVSRSKERNQLEVYFVDIGTTSWVDWSNVRKLHEKFMHTQCQAFCVKLMHVKPVNGTWPSEVHQFFMPYIADKIELKMVVGDVWAAEPLEVALFELQSDVHYSVNAKLVRDKCAESEGQLGTEVEWPQGLVNSSQSSFTIQMMKWAQTEQYETQDSGDEDYSSLIRKEVEIISVVDPSCIYIRFLMISPRQAKFYAELQEFYSAITHMPFPRKLGDQVVVKRTNQYHRGIIRALGTEQNGYLCTVELRDLGEVIQTDPHSIYSLEDYFANFPEFVTKCHLANITPAGDSGKWPRLATEFLTETLNTKAKILVTKCGKIDMERCSMPVIMWYTEFIPGGPLQRSRTILHSLNKMLMRNGLALKSRVQLVFPKRDELEPKDDEEESKKSSDVTPVIARELGISSWPKCPPFEQTKFTGVATYIDENAYIYFQDDQNKNHLQSVQEEINGFCNGCRYIPYNWQIGDLCLAKYHVDNCWYRGQITKCDPNAFKIVMIDYGNEEEVDKIEDLNHRIILHDIPSFAYRIRLDNVQAKNNVWTTSDLDLLHGAIVDQKIVVALVDKTSDPPTANVKCQKVDINQFMLLKSGNLRRMSFPPGEKHDDDDDSRSEDVIIIESEEESVELEYNQRQLPSAIPCGDLVNVKAINIQSYQKFVLDFGLHSEEKDAVRRLDDLHAEIIEDGPHQPCLTNLRNGMPCIALFSEDDLFYRGKIQEVLSDKVVVYFVDFGNTENVDVCNVKKIKREWVEGYPLDYLVATIPIKAVDPSRGDSLNNYMLEEVVPHVAFASIINFSPLIVKLYKKDKTTQAYQGLLDLALVKYCDEQQEG